MNSVLADSVTTTVVQPSYGTTGALQANIEARTGPFRYFHGVIDDVLIYDRALSISEVAGLCFNTVGIEELSLPSNFIIFPNPSNDQLKIDGLKLNGTLAIFNSLGEKIKELQI